MLFTSGGLQPQSVILIYYGAQGSDNLLSQLLQMRA